MTHEQRKVYEDKIDNLVAEKSREDCNIKSVELSLADYYKDLKAIEEKYDYPTRSAQLKSHKRKYNDAKNKLISVKLQYICHIINDLVESELFKTCDEAMYWLSHKFDIYYDNDDKSFTNLYNDIINTKEFDDNDWVYNKEDSTYDIENEWYWRYEDDGKVRLSIRENIVNDIYAFEAALKTEIQILKIKRNAEKREIEEKAEAARYQMYLKLKREFGG